MQSDLTARYSWGAKKERRYPRASQGTVDSNVPVSSSNPGDRASIERLVATVRTLEVGQIDLLIEMAVSMTRPVMAYVDPSSDIVDSKFASNFSARLLMHHATTAEKFKKKSFEYAFVAASVESGRNARLTECGTFPGADVIVNGVNFSCKTEAAAQINEARITISKLMEARWIRECETEEDFLNGVLRRVVPHLQGYERILILRAINRDAGAIEYKLVEIPVEVLRSIEQLTARDFGARTVNGGSSAKVRYHGEVAFTLRLDGSVEKVTIAGLSSDVCRTHASWLIPVLQDENVA